MKIKILKQNGFTLMELIVSLTIFTIMLLMLTRFTKNVFSYKTGFTNTLSVYDNSRTILQPIASEIRSVTNSALGAYPIDTANTTTFTFFADVNKDGTKEKVRYFLSGTTLRKGVISPAGNPVNYNGQEVLTDVVFNVRNTGANPIFEYFDTNYSGSSSPLSQPVDISRIRLIKITLLLDVDLTKPPDTAIITTQISLRNLKDNQ